MTAASMRTTRCPRGNGQLAAFGAAAAESERTGTLFGAHAKRATTLSDDLAGDAAVGAHDAAAGMRGGAAHIKFEWAVR